jgi:hypothetical protein
MSWRSWNSVRLRLQIGLQLLESLSGDEDINRALGSIEGNIETSAEGSLGLHEIKQNKP